MIEELSDMYFDKQYLKILLLKKNGGGDTVKFYTDAIFFLGGGVPSSETP